MRTMANCAASARYRVMLATKHLRLGQILGGRASRLTHSKDTDTTYAGSWGRVEGEQVPVKFATAN
jgi:hypothetical protein